MASTEIIDNDTSIDDVFEFNKLCLEPENDEGNTEYKLRLTDLDEDKITKRATQMKWRVNEGYGEAFYFIGVKDDGTIIGINEQQYKESCVNLEKIAARIDCKLITLNERVQGNAYIGEFLVRENETLSNNINLQIGVVGNVDSGKSTTIGTLTKGVLDDGRGRARLAVFNHKHEIATGRTSSIGHQIMGYDLNGQVVSAGRNTTWTDIVNCSSKVITFFDMAGHEKYLKTTIYGLTSMFPDYVLCMVGANMGINHMTKEHMSLCLTLRIPFIIIVSKIDIVPANILEENIAKINDVIRKGAKKIPFSIRNMDDVISAAKNMKSDTIIPIIQISNLSGFNLDLLKALLNVLPVRNDYAEFINKEVELLVDSTYSVTGHPTIIAGMLRSGIINVGDTVALGPYSHDGSYKQSKVKSIHNKYKDVKSVKAGSYVSISLKNVTRGEIKKGMVVVSDTQDKKIAVREFIAFLNILHSPTTIKKGYQPFIHCDQVRQSVQIVSITKINKKKVDEDDSTSTSTESIENADDNCLRTGDKAHCKLRFMMRPEYIKPGMRIIFREGKVKAFGKVLEVAC